MAMKLRDIVVVPRDKVPTFGLLPVLGYDTPRIGDRLYSTVGFASSVLDVVDEVSLVIAMDTSTGDISDIIPIQTCGYALHSRLTARGELLVGTGSFSTAVGIASEGQRAGRSCVAAFDPARRTEGEVPVLDEPALFGGDPTGNFVFVVDGRAWARVIDPSRLPDEPLVTSDLTQGPFWSWGFVDSFDPPSARRIEGRPQAARWPLRSTSRVFATWSRIHLASRALSCSDSARTAHWPRASGPIRRSKVSCDWVCPERRSSRPVGPACR